MNNQYYRTIQFTRFKVSNKGILWARLDEELTPRAIRFFAKRFPLFYIMMEHNNTTYVLKHGERLKKYNKKVETVLRMYERKLKDNKILCSLPKDGKMLWEEFYDTQYIKERKNHRLFHHWIPKHLKGLKGLEKEFDSLNPCKKLTDY